MVAMIVLRKQWCVSNSGVRQILGPDARTTSDKLKGMPGSVLFPEKARRAVAFDL